MNETDFKERLNQDARRLRTSLSAERRARIMAEVERTEMNAGLNLAPTDLRTAKLRRGSPWVHVAAVAAGCVLLAVVILARFQPVGELKVVPPETFAVQKMPESAADESLIRPAAVLQFMSYPVRIRPAAEDAEGAEIEGDEETVRLAKLLPCQQTVAALVDICRPAGAEF